MATFDPTELNKAARAWASNHRRKLIRSLRSVNIEKSSEKGLLDFGVHSRVKTTFGVADRVIFTFRLQGMFIEAGVGRGHPAESVRGNRAALTGKNRLKDQWISRVINDASVGELGTSLADAYGNAVVKNITL